MPPRDQPGEGISPPAIGPSVLERPRFRDRLGKARSLLASQLVGLRGRPKLDQEAWDELEEALILADVGVSTVGSLVQELKQRVRQDGLNRPEQLVGALRQELVSRLDGDRELRRAEAGQTTVWLFVGVNGVGKTTTIGKVGMREQSAGRARGHGRRGYFPGGGRRPAASVVGAGRRRLRAGQRRRGPRSGGVRRRPACRRSGDPLVLADTAGRLHTKVNLMEELKKVRRVADRPPGSVTEVLLVIDATTGQNGLVQARQFTDAVGITGVVLTKLDGTAKGGIAVAITSELGIPIKLVGLGEGPDDLVPFDAEEFVDAILPAD